MMKYAICNELFEGMDIADGLRLARELGYTGLEVAPFTLGERAGTIDQKTREAYRRLVAESGMEIIGLHWLLAKTEGFHLTTEDREVRRKTASYLQELIQLCSDLGGSLMVLGSPAQRNFPESMTHAEAIRNATEVITALLPSLESFGVRLAIEPLGPQEGNFLNHASQAREWIESIDHPMVRLHLDVKAMSTEGIPIATILRDNADLMIHFHANDPNRLGPGMGDVDQVPIFQALRDMDYQGWVSVEVFDFTPGVETILRESMHAMKRSVAHAG
jgi:sugar phosphate isomerase/epimerase